MSLSCPRCRGKSVKIKEKIMQVDGVDLQVDEHVCSGCSTVFYFQEQIISYIHAVVNSASKPKDTKK